MAEFGTPETWNMKVGDFIETELPKEKPQALLDLQEQSRKQRLLQSLQKIGHRLEDSSLDFINRENFAKAGGVFGNTAEKREKTLKDIKKYFDKQIQKGSVSMSDMEKKDFFNKLDKKYKGKNEDLDSKDEPSVKDVANQLKKAVKAHGKQADDLEKAIKSEEESFDIEKLKEDVNTLWSTAADDLEAIKEKAKYMKAQDKDASTNEPESGESDDESEKQKKGKTLVGSAKTKVETEPKVDYQK